MANQSTGLTRIIKAAGYSAKGIKAAWKNEAAFRQEAVLAILAIIVAFSFEFSMVERLFLISSVMLVVIVEMLNSAIEAVVDRIGSEYHELSGRAKDMGSAAVFLAMILALFIWVIIIWSYFTH
ncbi:diacylglycerol kinase [Xenorhabdus innexi]|uniref:Diacylglycerol kinase n=1 Tax=Xenorhabdus innexi TaxID=290109 RepID=A0A1N6N188_9GAMM|nr:diacylglycerol kinase [Xenorhabdus innexi]PHM31156.1 diacylglycerol kinase [Xenorhabdus innexi]SIP74804.1 Diacylglycerol kinase [Xenorhabdus innexi]